MEEKVPEGGEWWCGEVADAPRSALRHMIVVEGIPSQVLSVREITTSRVLVANVKHDCPVARCVELYVRAARPTAAMHHSLRTIEPLPQQVGTIQGVMNDALTTELAGLMKVREGGHDRPHACDVVALIPAGDSNAQVSGRMHKLFSKRLTFCQNHIDMGKRKKGVICQTESLFFQEEGVEESPASNIP